MGAGQQSHRKAIPCQISRKFFGGKNGCERMKIGNESYEDREEGCLFCEIPKERILDEDDLCYVVRDGFPVTDLHTLVIPKRHVETYFDLYQPELNSCNRMIQKFKDQIEKEDESVKGFNIGMNNGEVAGQTIFHCHVHLIPRREGDVENPRGGVRGVIPKKQKY